MAYEDHFHVDEDTVKSSNPVTTAFLNSVFFIPYHTFIAIFHPPDLYLLFLGAQYKQ